MDIVFEQTFKPKIDFHTTGNERYNTNTQIGITVVGCGGTGSRLIPLLAQHISNHNKAVDVGLFSLKIKQKMYLNLIDLSLDDFDVVEEKNLRRQAFYQFDVGLPKAQALARRYSALYGIEVKYNDDGFSAIDDSYKQFIFDCTDNKKVRQLIEHQVNNAYYKSVVLISCGNEDTFGQIYIKHRKRSYQKAVLSDYMTYLHLLSSSSGSIERIIQDKEIPTFVLSIPEFKDSPSLSCDQMLLIDDQSMPINNLMATLAFNAFYEIAAHNYLPYIRVNANVYNQFNTIYYTKKVLLNLLATALVGNIPDKQDICIAMLDSKNGGYASGEGFKRKVYDYYKEKQYGDLPTLLQVM